MSVTFEFSFMYQTAFSFDDIHQQHIGRLEQGGVNSPSIIKTLIFNGLTLKSAFSPSLRAFYQYGSLMQFASSFDVMMVIKWQNASYSMS